AKYNAEKAKHVIGPLSVTSSGDPDILSSSSKGDSENTRQRRESTQSVILDDLKSLSSKLGENYDSQLSLKRTKRETKEKSHLSLVSLEGSINEVNIGSLRVTLSK
ncbi:hypothetical protein L9F63_019777, partial [Diploptera punctata]